MAAVTPDARTVRLEAGRIRAETHALKLSLRQGAAHSREQLRTAEVALSLVRSRGDEPLPSPWSTLDWTSDDETLDGVLVPVH